MSGVHTAGQPDHSNVYSRQVVSALSGVPRLEVPRRTEQGSGRGTFDRGDLKEVADSIRYGATIDSLCNEGLAGGLMTLREPNSELHWASTRPEDNTPATAVAVGHFVQVGL
jgi:hypothetical protein